MSTWPKSGGRQHALLVATLCALLAERSEGINIHFPTPAPTEGSDDGPNPTAAPQNSPTTIPHSSPTLATTMPPNPSPTPSPVVNPTVFKEIAILQPVAGTYAYDLGLLVVWATKGDAIQKCNTVDVDLYQQTPDGSEYVNSLKTDFPNDLNAQFTWTPSTTVNSITQLPYGVDIVGQQYQIRVVCTIGFGDYSEFFDLSYTPEPTSVPTSLPSPEPTSLPTYVPSPLPTLKPSPVPTPLPTISLPPSPAPTATPSSDPTPAPSEAPTEAPTPAPTPGPSEAPTHAPTPAPSHFPTPYPSFQPTQKPTPLPSSTPSALPSPLPTPEPTYFPTRPPTHVPSPLPTLTLNPTVAPTSTPHPSHPPSSAPTATPYPAPTTPKPTHEAPATVGDVLSSASAGIAYACVAGVLLLGAVFVAYRRHTAVGGRGFKGEVDVDAGAFLQGDPTESFHGDMGGGGLGGASGGATTTPLIDPRDDSFASGWEDNDQGGDVV